MSVDRLWTWTIEVGDSSQTLVVYNPDDEVAGSRERDSWTWSAPYPDAVMDIMPESDAADRAIQRGWIERRPNDEY